MYLEIYKEKKVLSKKGSKVEKVLKVLYSVSLYHLSWDPNTLFFHFISMSWKFPKYPLFQEYPELDG